MQELIETIEIRYLFHTVRSNLDFFQPIYELLTNYSFQSLEVSRYLEGPLIFRER